AEDGPNVNARDIYNSLRRCLESRHGENEVRQKYNKNKTAYNSDAFHRIIGELRPARHHDVRANDHYRKARRGSRTKCVCESSPHRVALSVLQCACGDEATSPRACARACAFFELSPWGVWVRYP